MNNDLSKYYPSLEGITEEALDDNSSLKKILHFIEEGKHIVDVGCATGYLASLLQQKDCIVTGIEINPGAAKVAEKYCEKVIIADLDFVPITEILPNHKFDVVIFGDVLEHLRNPWKVLEESKNILKEDGFIVASIPNIAHGAIRLALLGGKFKYTRFGILDDTHLRFFTRETVEDLFQKTGYIIDKIDVTKLPVFCDSDLVPKINENNFSQEVIQDLQRDKDINTLQFIVRAFPLSQEGKYNLLKIRYEKLLVEQKLVESQLQQTQSQVKQINTELEVSQSQLQHTQSQLQQTQAELERSQSQLQQTQAELEASQSQLQQTQTELELAQANIIAMESSKFWKIRKINNQMANTTENIKTNDRFVVNTINGDYVQSLSVTTSGETETSQCESLSGIDEKRLLVTSRLQISAISQKMGNNPWQTISNIAYELCKNPCITVIISLYNYSHYIRECIDSVCKSNLYDLPGEIEVLIIDDCSTDSSVSIVEECLKETDIPISLIKKYFNTGLADVRNIGLKLARSPYVFILDADNWIYPNCLSVLYREITLSHCAATYGKIRRFENQTNKDIDTVSSKEWDVGSLVKDPYIDAMAMFDKEIILKVGAYSIELIEYGWFGWEDYDLWLKLAENGYSCKLVPEILSSYRLHPSSMINVTRPYILNMSRYFNYKFYELAKLHTQSDRLFGSWRSEVCSGKYVKIRPRLNAVQSDELKKANATIEAITSSKFWKLRNKWFKFKKFLGLTKDISVKV
jgi:glycosyltransferase involved in cell wall biosynthesis/2-polyprenyl-3-methyl-5-hydroxy-6-metoxy-1,4-benzoquinol methylase